MVTCLRYSPDGAWLASSSHDGISWLGTKASIKIWSVRDRGPAVQTVTNHYHSITSIDFSPDGTKFISSSHDNTVMIWNFNDGLLSVYKTLSNYTQNVEVVKFSPDGNLFASAGNDKTVRIFSIDDEIVLIHTLTGHTDPIKYLAFSPDSKTLVSLSADGMKLWDI